MRLGTAFAFARLLEAAYLLVGRPSSLAISSSSDSRLSAMCRGVSGGAVRDSGSGGGADSRG